MRRSDEAVNREADRRGACCERMGSMLLRQCAWCLRLINGVGERISPTPLPKLYEASHGICGVCGTLWMEQVMAQPTQNTPQRNKEEATAATPKGVPSHTVTELILQLQQSTKELAKANRPKVSQPKPKGPLRIV